MLLVGTIVLGEMPRAHASKEGILELSRFHLESEGIGESGPVSVDGQRDRGSHIVELKISAFGKEFALSYQQLIGLAELPVNGIRISYERGYEQLGGRTIYVQLQMGFTSRTTRQALITVTESGKIEIGKVEFLKEP